MRVMDLGFCHVIPGDTRRMLRGRTVWVDDGRLIVASGKREPWNVTVLENIGEPVVHGRNEVKATGILRIRTSCAPCGGCGRVCQVPAHQLVPDDE